MTAHARTLVMALCTLGVLPGCHGTSVPFIGVPTPSPTPTPTPNTGPTPGPVILTVSSVSFTATGPGAAQTVSVSETNFSGTFTSSTPPAGRPNSCSGIATIASASASSFVITAVAAGTCDYTISGGGGTTATVNVVVTTTTVGGH